MTPPLGTLRTLLVTTPHGKQHKAIYVYVPGRWVVGKAAPALGWLWQTPTDEVAAQMVKRELTYKWVSEDKINA